MEKIERILSEDEIVKKITQDIQNLIILKIPLTIGLSDDEIFESALAISNSVFEDLKSLARKDPATNGSFEYVYNSYSAFKAVMHYRVANYIYYKLEIPKNLRLQLSRDISEQIKNITNIEIHPAAKIGRGFVIDHGFGTVIGETSEIGDNCYLLQGVILGSKKIVGETKGKRHPTLGNNVEIGAFVKILGPVKIGNNVIISPGALVTFDVDDNNKILIVNQLQIVNTPQGEVFSTVEIYGLIPFSDKILSLYGLNLKNLEISLILGDPDDEDYFEYPIVTEVVSDDCLKLEFGNMNILKFPIKNKFHKLRIRLQNKREVIYITESFGLRKILNNYINKN